ncbi:MAG: N-6 DNA methylase [Betaproteobacteria bacterium]|nr:N-6 DNA methylase [Betaproteobacteria bacterium]
MFEQAFKNIDADLRNEAGCTTELDYTEQTSWLLFLKYLDGLEQDKAMEAELEGKKYAFILDESYRWSSWAAPKARDGKLDHNKAMTGDDLREFVDRKLFPYLRQQPKLTADNLKTLQERSFYGKEKKPLTYVIAIMNMILHGIEAPNIIHTNTLTENLADIQDKDRMDVILANPPFGGGERKEVQQNFPIRTGETAFLFLQHFIKMLKAGGRAGVVIKNTFLSNTDNASVSLRKLLLESCNLHTVLDCPGGTFQGAGVKTVVLFFEKGTPTRKIWFYQLDPGRNMGKTNPLNDADLAEFVELQKTQADSDKSWSVDAKSIVTATYDLSVKNPNGGEAVIHRSPQVIMDEIAALDTESADVLGRICILLKGGE